MSAKYTFLAWDTPVKDSSTKLALLQLANNADDNGFSYYSISKMAKACDMSERTFMRKIQLLEEMGVLKVERRANRPSLYTLIGDEMGVTICHLHGTGVTDCHAEVTICHAEGDNLSHDPIISPKSYPKSISRFTPPTYQEALEYFTEKGFPNKAEADKFVDFYEMKGWMVGKTKMKDWKAAVRNWTKSLTPAQQQERKKPRGFGE